MPYSYSDMQKTGSEVVEALSAAGWDEFYEESEVEDGGGFASGVPNRTVGMDRKLPDGSVLKLKVSIRQEAAA